VMFCTSVVRLVICSVMLATSGSSTEPGARQVVSPNWLVAACQPMGQTQWPCGVTANGALHATHLLFLWSQRAQCWNLKKHSSCAARRRGVREVWVDFAARMPCCSVDGGADGHCSSPGRCGDG